MSTEDNEIKLPLQVHCYHDTIEVVEEVKRNLHIFYLFIYLFTTACDASAPPDYCL